jgi:hypothetical protein
VATLSALAVLDHYLTNLGLNVGATRLRLRSAAVQNVILSRELGFPVHPVL